jgi:hypothetical protein
MRARQVPGQPRSLFPARLLQEEQESNERQTKLIFKQGGARIE